MLKDNMGGTTSEVANMDEACRIVPSPPKVATRSVFRGNASRASSDVDVEYTGNGKSACTSVAVVGSSKISIDGYAVLIWLACVSRTSLKGGRRY